MPDVYVRDCVARGHNPIGDDEKYNPNNSIGSVHHETSHSKDIVEEKKLKHESRLTPRKKLPEIQNGGKRLQPVSAKGGKDEIKQSIEQLEQGILCSYYEYTHCMGVPNVVA